MKQISIAEMQKQNERFEEIRNYSALEDKKIHLNNAKLAGELANIEVRKYSVNNTISGKILNYHEFIFMGYIFFSCKVNADV